MPSPTAGAILAGGDGHRLGGRDKALIPLGGRTLFERVLDSLKPQTGPCAVCVRRHTTWTDAYALPVLTDIPAEDRGPLGGIAAALTWSQTLNPTVQWLITVPVDIPFLPPDLVDRLTSPDVHADVAVATSGGQVHHTVAAWKPAMCKTVATSIKDHAEAVHRVLEKIRTVGVEWPVSHGDPFFNINTPEDLATVEDRLKTTETSGVAP